MDKKVAVYLDDDGHFNVNFLKDEQFEENLKRAFSDHIWSEFHILGDDDDPQFHFDEMDEEDIEHFLYDHDFVDRGRLEIIKIRYPG